MFNPKKRNQMVAMRTEDINICILRIEGTNCEQETYQAFKQLGANPEIVHLKQLLAQVRDEERRDLFEYQCLMLPGGFSSGDYIRAGAIFSARMKTRLRDKLVEFIENGYLVGGICNGFQILVELGLLPAFEATISHYPQVCLAINDSDRFECRPALLKHETKKCAFTHKIPPREVLCMPCAHAEGKLTPPMDIQEEALQQLIDNDQIVFRYVDPSGEYAGYPWNPNGSIYNIAGICNPAGNVFGMMPHPERVVHQYTMPDWTRDPARSQEDGDGKMVFQSALEHITNRF